MIHRVNKLEMAFGLDDAIGAGVGTGLGLIGGAIQHEYNKEDMDYQAKLNEEAAQRNQQIN